MTKGFLIALSVAMLAGTPGNARAIDLTYAGSSTIAEYVIADAAYAFATRTGIKFARITAEGSRTGVEKVLRGEAQVGGVSRSLQPAEKSLQIAYQIIGYDAMLVFVHETNPVRTLTRGQLKQVFTGQIRNWRDVGGRDTPIVVMTLGQNAGMIVEFQHDVLDGAPYRSDRRLSSTQAEQISALGAEPGGIATLSRGLEQKGIHALAIDGFTPEPAHVRSGAYLLSRPLILVFSPGARPEVRRFVEFVLGAEGQALVARRFIPSR